MSGVIHGAAAQQGILSQIVAWSPIGQPWLHSLYTTMNGSSDVVLDGSGNVQEWKDQSGHNRHATQSNASYRPPYTANDTRAFASHPSVGAFSRLGRKMLKTPAGGSYKHLYMVMGFEDGITNDFILYERIISFDSDAEGLLGWPNQDFLYHTSQTDQVEKNGGASSNTWLPLPLSVCHVKLPATLTNDSAYIGSRHNQDDRVWNGPMVVFAFTDGSESTADSERFVGWLAHHTGIQSSLVSGHPYKTDPP